MHQRRFIHVIAIASGTTAAVCRDKLPDCVEYGSYACRGAYQAWGKANCAQFCGHCGICYFGLVSYYFILIVNPWVKLLDIFLKFHLFVCLSICLLSSKLYAITFKPPETEAIYLPNILNR